MKINFSYFPNEKENISNKINFKWIIFQKSDEDLRGVYILTE